jgi:hypothetical protein
VCLFQRTPKPTEKPADEKEARLPNIVYAAIAGEVVNRRFVLLKNFVLNGQESASNPLLHIHANPFSLHHYREGGNLQKVCNLFPTSAVKTILHQLNFISPQNNQTFIFHLF